MAANKALAFGRSTRTSFRPADFNVIRIINYLELIVHDLTL
jgi:hypothetical protein